MRGEIRLMAVIGFPRLRLIREQASSSSLLPVLLISKSSNPPSMRQVTCLLLLLTVLLALLTVTEAATYHLVGQWMHATKNTATENLLAEALQKKNPSLKSQLCFTEVTAIEQQIVNGIHFRYHVRGCETATPGRCNSDACANEKKFDIELFTQPWADVLQVMSAVDVQ